MRWAQQQWGVKPSTDQLHMICCGHSQPTANRFIHSCIYVKKQHICTKNSNNNIKMRLEILRKIPISSRCRRECIFFSLESFNNTVITFLWCYVGGRCEILNTLHKNAAISITINQIIIIIIIVIMNIIIIINMIHFNLIKIMEKNYIMIHDNNNENNKSIL